MDPTRQIAIILPIPIAGLRAMGEMTFRLKTGFCTPFLFVFVIWLLSGAMASVGFAESSDDIKPLPIADPPISLSSAKPDAEPDEIEQQLQSSANNNARKIGKLVQSVKLRELYNNSHFNQLKIYLL